MNFEEKLEKLKKITEREMQGSGCVVHDWNHVLRVFRNAEMLWKEEGGNWEIIAPAVLLHDVVRPVTKGIKNDHALLSSHKARPILEELCFDHVDKITTCILRHSSSSSRKLPETIEEKIVWDADKIDGFGLMGVARTMILSGERSKGVEETAKEWLEEIKRIAGTTEDIDTVVEKWLFTDTARRKAKKKVAFFIDFYKTLLGESEEEKYYSFFQP